MKNKIMFTGLLLITLILLFISCSSAPKNKDDIFLLRNQAENLLETGNREAGRGNFNSALIFLNEALRNAILSDDPAVITKCRISLGNVLYSTGETDKAFFEWEQAISEAQKSGNRELLAVCNIYKARGNLMSGRVQAESLLEIITFEQGYLRSDRLFIAFSWQAKGLTQRTLGFYSDAEDSIRRSLEIHEKDRYLENSSYDWYIIASIRSLAGNTQGALQALDSAIVIDRRIENSWGLAANWRAVGDVYRKQGSEHEALEAYMRARAIYEAMGNHIEAAEIDQRIRSE